MSLRKFCLGVALAFGMAQGAHAATIVTYDLWLRYDGTEFDDAWVYQVSNENGELFHGDIGVGEYDWGFDGFYSHLPIGARVKFTATVLYPDEPFEWGEYYSNGGRATSCAIADIGCSATYTERNGDDFILAIDDHTDISKTGNTIRHYFWGRYHDRPDYSQDIRREYEHQTARFTIIPEPSPVPLPATAALLPLGIGALALMRRRRVAAG